MKAGDAGSAQHSEDQSPPEVGRSAERCDEDARHGRSQCGEQSRVKAVREITVQRLSDGRGECKQPAQHARLRQGDPQPVDEQRLENAHRATIEVDQKMPDGE